MKCSSCFLFILYELSLCICVYTHTLLSNDVVLVTLSIKQICTCYLPNQIGIRMWFEFELSVLYFLYYNMFIISDIEFMTSEYQTDLDVRERQLLMRN